MGFQEQTKKTRTPWLLAIFHLHPGDCVGTEPSEILRGGGHVRAMGRVISPGQDFIRTSFPLGTPGSTVQLTGSPYLLTKSKLQLEGTWSSVGPGA